MVDGMANICRPDDGGQVSHRRTLERQVDRTDRSRALHQIEGPFREARIVRMADIIQIGALAAPAKVPKTAAGYIHRNNTDYRCKDCTLFIPGKKRCAFHGPADLIHPNGYCIYWGEGKPKPMLVTWGCYTLKESGYGELRNGTLCVRCVFFNGTDDCKRVDRNSDGDDPGRIDPHGCCANQTPRVMV